MEISRRRLGVGLMIWGVGSLFFLAALQGCSAAAAVVPTVAPVARLATETEIVPTDTPFVPAATETPVVPVTEIPLERLIEEIAQQVTAVSTPQPHSPTATNPPTPQPQPTATFAAYGVRVPLGQSVQGRTIEAVRFGFGTDVLVFVGGMHGGFEWNTILLAYEAIDYFSQRPEAIPANISLYIIPVANPDGQYLVTGIEGRFRAEDVAEITIPGRFNGNGVDLNRNWDCEWQQVATWNGREVDGGERPFSEPETELLRRFFLRQNPKTVLFWHSKADGVYAGGCRTPFPDSITVGDVFAQAATYNAHETFTAYEVTGDASDWLATQNIPSFTVELTVYDEIEWTENLGGMLAMLAYFGD